MAATEELAKAFLPFEAFVTAAKLLKLEDVLLATEAAYRPGTDCADAILVENMRRKIFLPVG
ncbi:hypothetical protein [Mesorhizobium sp. 1B3]|uniref:hypothetical protein n=1 Tax=Mesorhizobium sp. 1B3 TaxID=3243599 RepID=UPI003D9823F8